MLIPTTSVIRLGILILVGSIPANIASAELTAHHRRFVVCLDGTWNSAEVAGKPTGAAKLCRSTLPFDENGWDQISYYHTGVGAIARYRGAANRLLSLSDRIFGGAWGAGFEENVIDALTFLVLNYSYGDELFIFGFSRGGATASALTQFIDWAGGLPAKEDAYYLPRLYGKFLASFGRPVEATVTLDSINEERRVGGYPPIHLRPVTVKYLAVWDMVIALGSRFSDASAMTSFYAGPSPAACVQHARQALAIDEARSDFLPHVWTSHLPQQTLEQHWFVGFHSNVGGGFEHDGVANIPLRWLVGFAEDLGLSLDQNYLTFFHPYAYDRLNNSSSFMYRTLDFLRRRSGKRQMMGYPIPANLEIDPSVLQRLRATPEELVPNADNTKQAPYRPENVLLFLACQPSVDDYLRNIGVIDVSSKPLPDDVRERIHDLRPRCSKIEE